MFGGSPHFLFVFYRPDRRENVRSESIVKLYLYIDAHVFSVKKASLYGPYTKDINTYVYIWQPGYRSFVDKKCADPPNLRTTPRLTKSLTAHTFQGVTLHRPRYCSPARGGI